jgi:hypothetical protein
VLYVVKSIGPIGFALWGWLFQTPCFVLVSKMILVASILFDVYAIYVTLFQQVLKMHGSCLPTQLFVLLLKASESSEKEASRRQIVQRKKGRSRRASFSRGRRRYAPFFGELCDGEVYRSVWYPFVVATKYVESYD